MSFVIGFNCSGASLLTLLIQRICDCRDSLPFLLKPSVDEEGTSLYEGLELSALNSQLLESVAHGWDSPWLAKPRFDECMSNVDSHAVEQFLTTHPTLEGCKWIDNDPKLCLTVDIINEIANIAFPSIGIIRNPLDATSSLRRLTGISVDHSMGLWIIYNYHAFIANKSLPIELVCYDQLIKGSLATVCQIARYLNEHKPELGSLEPKNIQNELDSVLCSHVEAINSEPCLGSTCYPEENGNRFLVHAAVEMWKALTSRKDEPYLPTAEIYAKASDAIFLILSNFNSIFPSTFYSYHSILSGNWKSSLQDRWELLRRNEELSVHLEQAARIHKDAIANLDSSLIIRELQREILAAMLARESNAQKLNWNRRSMALALRFLKESTIKTMSLQIRISQLLQRVS